MTGPITDQGKPPQLPAITFINGPQPLANEVANILSDVVSGTIAYSFEEPLRNAANGLFHNSDPSVDIGTLLNLPTPIPSQNDNVESYARFMLRMYDMLVIAYGNDVLGALAVRAVQDGADYFERSVFADATITRTDDIRRVIKAFDAENCLIVNLQGVPEIRSDSTRIVNILDGDQSPLALIQQISKLLAPAS